MYFIAVNFGVEGWALYPHKTLEDVKKSILNGETHGQEFKVFKEMSLEITEED